MANGGSTIYRASGISQGRAVVNKNTKGRAVSKGGSKQLTAAQNAERVRSTRKRYLQERGGVREVLRTRTFVDAHSF